MPLSREDAREIAKEAVKEAFIEMGINKDTPIEMQKDMAFLRQNRERCESLLNQVAGWAILAFLTLSSGMAWAGLLSRLKGGGE